MCNSKKDTHLPHDSEYTHFCQTKFRHPKRYALLTHDLLHNGWRSIYALLTERKSIKFCKFWYQICTSDKTCSYAPLLVNPRYICLSLHKNLSEIHHFQFFRSIAVNIWISNNNKTNNSSHKNMNAVSSTDVSVDGWCHTLPQFKHTFFLGYSKKINTPSAY